MTCERWRGAGIGLWLVMFLGLVSRFASAQDLPGDPLVPAIGESPGPAAPEVVQVEPPARDDKIAERLARILTATGWYRDPEVRVDEGVVFLTGTSATGSHVDWAGRLARNTQGVVAVVNQMEHETSSPWDFSWTLEEIDRLVRGLLHGGPLALAGVFLLGLSWLTARLFMVVSRRVLRSRIRHELLRQVLTGTLGAVVFLLGLYFILRIFGLTRLAVSVLGGTGLAGLILGIAFRDIAENLLASILLSLQRPFETGDLVEVVGIRGYVHHMSTRSTALMTLESRLVQIPNATIYKEVITNFWASPTLRLDFSVSIELRNTIADAQAIGLTVMREHDAVLSDPLPMVLVDDLEPMFIKLRFYFWIDPRRHSDIKVRSAVMRLTRRAYQQAGITMPDEVQKVSISSGMDIRLDRSGGASRQADTSTSPLPAGVEPPEQPAERDPRSEAEELREQARSIRLPEAGPNLLEWSVRPSELSRSPLDEPSESE